MTTTHTDPYPLTFRPILMEKVWGGDRLARFGKPVSRGSKVGESWELADMGSTSASGAGGGAARSVISNGALAGRTLNDAVALWGHALLGRESAGPFPLLVKYLDAMENLSVQVHPSPAYAASHAGAHLKTECWYIMDAAPGALIYKGVRPGVTRERFERALRSGDGAGVVELMDALPAVVGECHNLPSGTVHALGAGVLVAEVQTPSDTTFRVYDWGRVGRELHVEQAMACIDFGPAPAATKLEPGGVRSRLVTTEFFTLDELCVNAGASEGIAAVDRCVALLIVAGHGRLISTTGAFEPMALRAGVTSLIPGSLVSSSRVEAGAHSLTALIASV
jgi:mannose-6-phosphate isomerase